MMAGLTDRTAESAAGSHMTYEGPRVRTECSHIGINSAHYKSNMTYFGPVHAKQIWGRVRAHIFFFFSAMIPPLPPVRLRLAGFWDWMDGWMLYLTAAAASHGDGVRTCLGTTNCELAKHFCCWLACLLCILHTLHICIKFIAWRVE